MEVGVNVNVNITSDASVIKCAYCQKEISNLFPLLPFTNNLLTNVFTNPDVIFYENKPYHQFCLKSHLLNYRNHVEYEIKSTLIPIEFKMSLEDIVYFISDLQKNSDTNSRVTKNLIIKLSQIVCEANSTYIMCNNPTCKKLILRSAATVGEKTKAYQQILFKQQSESEIKPENDIEYQKNGKPHKVLYFCCAFCDGYFSSKLQHTLQNIVDIARNNINEIKDKTDRFISMYETQLVNRKTPEEINEIKKTYEMQRRIQINQEVLQMSKKVKEITKEWIG
jgi:hypothetical protein